MPNSKTSAEGCQILSMPNGRTSVEGLCFYIYIDLNILLLSISLMYFRS